MGLSITKFYPKKEELCILMGGIDGAGKTTILYRFLLGRIVTTISTIGFNIETMEYNNKKITLLDYGGNFRFRRLWSQCYKNTHGVIFVVDSCDRDRADEARDELFRLMNKDCLKDVVLLVHANKQDLPNSMSNTEVMDMIGLTSLKQHHWVVVLFLGRGCTKDLTGCEGTLLPEANKHC